MQDRETPLSCIVKKKGKSNGKETIRYTIFDNPQLKKKYGKDWEEEHK